MKQNALWQAIFRGEENLKIYFMWPKVNVFKSRICIQLEHDHNIQINAKCLIQESSSNHMTYNITNRFHVFVIKINQNPRYLHPFLGPEREWEGVGWAPELA